MISQEIEFVVFIDCTSCRKASNMFPCTPIHHFSPLSCPHFKVKLAVRPYLYLSLSHAASALAAAVMYGRVPLTQRQLEMRLSRDITTERGSVVHYFSRVIARKQCFIVMQ